MSNSEEIILIVKYPKSELENYRGNKKALVERIKDILGKYGDYPVVELEDVSGNRKT